MFVYVGKLGYGISLFGFIVVIIERSLEMRDVGMIVVAYKQSRVSVDPVRYFSAENFVTLNFDRCRVICRMRQGE